MTEENLQNAIKTMQAFANGEQIEYAFLSDNAEWYSADAPSWNWSNYKYRVKPQPKYRSFNNTKECFMEMRKHKPFGWVANHYGAMLNIGSLSDTQGITFAEDGSKMSYKHCTECGLLFADGTPFGIKVNN